MSSVPAVRMKTRPLVPEPYRSVRRAPWVHGVLLQIGKEARFVTKSCTAFDGRVHPLSMDADVDDPASSLVERLEVALLTANVERERIDARIRDTHHRTRCITSMEWLYD